MDNELIDRIHECAFAPESWPSVIGDLSRKVDAVGGALFIFGPERTCWTTTPGSEQLVGSMVDEGWMRRGKFLQRAQAMRHPGFLREYDVFSPEELDEEPLWRDWFRPRGLGWGAGTTVPLPTGECVYLALNRSFRRGPVETEFIQEVDVYRPHLARAIVVSARHQLERARAASETLALLGLPGLVLNDGGRVMAANALCEQRKDLLIWRAQDRVALTDGAASALLNQSIEQCARGDAAATRSFPVRDASGQAACIAHLIPVRLSARDIFVRCAAALILTPIAAPNAPTVELLQSLFDLTPAESQVARHLASGASIDDISDANGVSRNTIRAQLRAVMDKTGCGRQAEVVALLAGVPTLRSPR